jgi:hypothetical protein
MSRKPEDTAVMDKGTLIDSTGDTFPPQPNLSGFRLVFTKCWNLYVVHEATGYMYFYETEDWVEWLRRLDIVIREMFLYSDRRSPLHLLSNDSRTHLTLDAFLASDMVRNSLKHDDDMPRDLHQEGNPQVPEQANVHAPCDACSSPQEQPQENLDELDARLAEYWKTHRSAAARFTSSRGS